MFIHKMSAANAVLWTTCLHQLPCWLAAVHQRRRCYGFRHWHACGSCTTHCHGHRCSIAASLIVPFCLQFSLLGTKTPLSCHPCARLCVETYLFAPPPPIDPCTVQPSGYRPWQQLLAARLIGLGFGGKSIGLSRCCLWCELYVHMCVCRTAASCSGGILPLHVC